MDQRAGYSDIGFRSETSIQELKNYLDKKPVNKLAIGDAQKLIQSFDDLISNKGTYPMADEYGALYIRLLTEDILDRERIIASVESINSAKNTLEEITKDNKGLSGEEIKKTLKIFQKISKECREKLSSGSCH